MIPVVWLEPHSTFWHAIGLFSVAQNSFTSAMLIAGLLLTGLVVYAFSRLPKERQQKLIGAWVPIVIGVGLLLAAGVPVRSNDECGNRHSVVAAPLAPIFLNDPHKNAPLLTYEFDDTVGVNCDRERFLR